MLELAHNIATKKLRRLNRVSSRDGNIFASDLGRKSGLSLSLMPFVPDSHNFNSSTVAPN